MRCWLDLFHCLILSELVWMGSILFVSASESDGLKIPNLPLGDINVVVLTDTHSWVGGHAEKEELDADYGDVLSFYRLLRGQMEAIEAARDPDDPSTKHELFFVMNGDWIDGTGLAMNGDPSYLIPILERMPWDAVNIGNHELYRKSVIQYMTRPGGFVEWFGERYITSNVILTKSQHAVGKAYRLLKGKHSNVLVFGFLYDMTDNDSAVTVVRVQDAVTAEWFEVALRDDSYDAILVLAHCGHDDPAVTIILNRIRSVVGDDMPVQFITGHTHVRAVSTPGNYSSSFEAGRYLNTVGFVSFPTRTTIQLAEAAKKAAAEQAAPTANASQPTGGPGIDPTDGPGTDHTDGTGTDSTINPTSNVPGTNLTNNNNASTNYDLTDAPSTAPTTNDVSTDPTDGSGERLDRRVNEATGHHNNTTTTTTTTTTTVMPTPSPTTVRYNDEFQHVFIDAKFSSLADALGVSSMTTDEGNALSTLIFNVQEDLGLFKIVGCIEEDHFLEKGLYEPNSLWGLFCNHVVPHVFPWNLTTTTTTQDNPKVVVFSQGAWRYDLFAKELVFDEVVAVSPFNETMFVFSAVPGSVVHQVNQTLNANPGFPLPILPNYIMCPSPASNLPPPQQQPSITPAAADEQLFDLVTTEWEVSRIRKILQDVWPENSTLDIPTEVSMDHVTSTSIWLDFFDQTDLCQTENKGTHKVPKPKHPNHNNNKTTPDDTPESPNPNKHISSSSGYSSEFDAFRIDFFWLALAVVAIFGGIYVRQRARIWRLEEQSRELMMREALEEYNEQHGYGGYRDGEDHHHHHRDDEYDPQQHCRDDDNDIQLGYLDHERLREHQQQQQQQQQTNNGSSAQQEQQRQPAAPQHPPAPTDLLDNNDDHFEIGDSSSNHDGNNNDDDDDDAAELIRIDDERILELL